jgi:hypothetical protein
VSDFHFLFQYLQENTPDEPNAGDLLTIKEILTRVKKLDEQAKKT